jgi:hypothetical protein
VETDNEGRYRLKPIPPEAVQGKRWASPEIVKILTQSGKDFSNLLTSDHEDEYYSKL